MTSISHDSVESAATRPAEGCAATASVSGHPPTPTRLPTTSATTALIANLQGTDVTAVEAATVGVGDAFRRGDKTVIAERLSEQATLLDALGVKLLIVAGRETKPQVIQIYTGLALRALEQARKALATLCDLQSGPRTQNNIQVNLDGRNADVRGSNEILGEA